jgi:hypothetical protein
VIRQAPATPHFERAAIAAADPRYFHLRMEWAMHLPRPSGLSDRCFPPEVTS